ncbi:MAG: 2-oxoglutarate dehydrogenase E1 component [Chloroflexota bacterium]
MGAGGESVWAEVVGANAAYLEELYDRYRTDPASVEPPLRAAFERAGPPHRVSVGLAGWAAAGPPAGPAPTPRLIAAAVELAHAILAYGYRAARLDPLGSEPPGDDELRAEAHGIRQEDLAALPASIVNGVGGAGGVDGPAADSGGAANALQAIRALRQAYQGTTGYEFEHVSNAEERAWLHEAVLSGRFRPPRDAIDERKLLERLTEVGAFERFLQRAFPGQTRFSLEGLGIMVPMLDEIVGAAAEVGTRAVMLGMAHRGRLNVLAHVLGKPYEQIIGEFLGRYRLPNTSASGTSGGGWTGDVKYHLGARRAYRGGQQVEMVISLVPNPSHLEFVDPVVQGMSRAFGEKRDQPGPPLLDEQAALAVLVHGDASFPGEGVVAETLNLSRLPGYRGGGTIHLIANNQLGFTAAAELTRSTLFASDLAKGFEMPVIHVNADDPEACIAAARLAHAYRDRFRRDVVLDLIGYRRWGHNEGDDASFTQPRMYATIAGHPTVRELWAREMVRRGLLTEEEARGMLQAAIERLHAIRRSLAAQPAPAQEPPAGQAGLDAGGPAGGLGSAGPANQVDTAVPAEMLDRLNQELLALPAGFKAHPKLERFLERRRAVPFGKADNGHHGGKDRQTAGGGGPEQRVDWAHAEALAFASLLAEGHPVRLTGQDTARGTFSQRHLVLRDVEREATFTPLQSIPSARASFEVWDSPLSEQATLGFEFGYNVQAADTLVLWEAQYGDFVNAAQVTVDQFVAGASSKWGQRSSLVLLLPHGYEGQGPDHSSAQLERFLQLAAEDNLRIANCSTAAQYFHILRRQAALLDPDPRPLVLLTPKSLLRNPSAASDPAELSQGRFQPVIDDTAARRQPEAVRRLILCSGKVYFDLAATRAASNGAPGPAPVAVARVEEIYPFPADELRALLDGYPRLEEVVWLQEEPRDRGAWLFAAPRLRDLLGDRLPLVYIGRTRRASAAEGAYEWHATEQARLVGAAFHVDSHTSGEVAVCEVQRVR